MSQHVMSRFRDAVDQVSEPPADQRDASPTQTTFHIGCVENIAHIAAAQKQDAGVDPMREALGKTDSSGIARGVKLSDSARHRRGKHRDITG